MQDGSESRRVKVGISAHALGMRFGGIETYVRGAVSGLGAVDPDGDYTLFVNPPMLQGPIAGADRMRRVAVRPQNQYIRNTVTLPLALLRERVDVVHVQYAAPPLCPARVVTTVHDLVHERYPQFFTPDVVRAFRITVPLTVRQAAVVCTDSEFSRQDIVRRYRVPPEKVVVTPCAADPMFEPLRDPARLAAVRARYGTSEQFILCVGNLQPRKNLRAMIEAYVKLRRADATRHKLVLVGRAYWLFDEIFAVARASGYADDLVFTDYVPDADLVALYNAADLFVYPSIYEGFGIPPLEAMACGTPVVCSNTSSLPEVVGDAALMVDPLDVEALAESVARVLDDEALRARLAARGPERAAFYTWEKTGQILADVYRTAAGLPQ